MPAKQSAAAAASTTKPKPRQPQTMQLECGCKVGYGQLIRSCETARQLERDIKAANLSGQEDVAERAAFKLEEHVTEQLERMEAES